MSLSNGDLAGTVLPVISIDEFEPKAGKENQVIVVAFYLKDQNPADDLNTFIQRGFIDTLDVEVSPNTDEEGNYLVFVEMSRDKTFFNKFLALIRDVENLTGPIDWSVRTYYSGDKVFKIQDSELLSYLIVDPENYVKKDEFKVEKIEESIFEFFKDSLVTDLTVDGNCITINHNRRKIVAEVIDIGDYDTVIGSNFLSESAFKVGQRSYEAKILENLLGNCQILPIDKYLCISKNNQIMLLANTQLNYGV